MSRKLVCFAFSVSVMMSMPTYVQATDKPVNNLKSSVTEHAKKKTTEAKKTVATPTESIESRRKKLMDKAPKKPELHIENTEKIETIENKVQTQEHNDK
jgi:hypothetical protein